MPMLLLVWMVEYICADFRFVYQAAYGRRAQHDFALPRGRCRLCFCTRFEK